MAFNYYLGRTLDEIQFWYGFNDKEKNNQINHKRRGIFRIVNLLYCNKI